MNEHIKAALDVATIGTVGATLAGWLPPLAAFFAIVWSIMQIVMNWSKFSAYVKGWFK